MAIASRPTLTLPSSWRGTPVVLVLDGTNLLHRSHHAMMASGLTDRNGQPVWALHGLGTTIARLAEQSNPHRIVTAFDTSGGCPARRVLAPEYKGTRKAPDPALVRQLDEAPALLGRAGLGATVADGWEADDLMASAVTAARARGWLSVVVSSDRDAYQLIADDCVVAKPDGSTWDAERLHAEIGVSPRGYQHLAALRGETSDNLTGVPGWGAKTAVKLLTTFADPCDVLDQPDALAMLRPVVGPAAAARLIEHAALYRRNLEVGTLNGGLPVDAALAQEIDPSKARDAFAAAGLVAAAGKLHRSLPTPGLF